MANSTVVQDISDQITCSICIDHFKIPKTVIPCLHNFCKGCLQCVIESTATHKFTSNRPPHDPKITAIFTFPCPQCRGPVEFPVRIPRPWKMKQIAIEVAEEEFKTNFQIEHQLEIIKKRIEKGCPQHEGEVRIWYCKSCQMIICQFCMQESHDPAEHGVTLLKNVASKKRQEMSVHKEILNNSILQFEQKSAEIQSHLESIFNVRSTYQEQQQKFMNEIQKAKVEILSLETAFRAQGDSFNKQLTSNETFSLEIFRHVSDKLECCKTMELTLQKALSSTDVDLVEQAQDVNIEKIEADTLLEFSIANIPEPPKVPVDQMKQGVQRVMNIVSDLQISISSKTVADSDVPISTEDGLVGCQEPSENTLSETATEEKKPETKALTPAINKSKPDQTVPKTTVKEVTKQEITQSEKKGESNPDVENGKLSEEKYESVHDSNKPGPKVDKIHQKYMYKKDQGSTLNADSLPHIPDNILDKQPPEFPKMEGGGTKVRQRNEKGPEPTLKKSENAWRPKWQVVKPTSDEEAKTVELMKSITSILNKLTPHNFQPLMAKALQLPIDNEERLMVVVDLVFKKAITEPAFSEPYANMCRVLSWVKVPATKGLVRFRTVLINRCCREYETDTKGEVIREEMKKKIEELEKGTPARNLLEDKLFIAKRKVLGNIRFFGELFRLQMLTENLMHDCICKLLHSNNDESLECMSQLIITVGKDLDHKRAKNRMDQYFTQITKITGNKNISARIRFMLQDVEDLRRCNWIPRKDDNNPKKITQIHQEAKPEDQLKKIKCDIVSQSGKSRERKSGRGSRPGPPQNRSNLIPRRDDNKPKTKAQLNHEARQREHQRKKESRRDTPGLRMLSPWTS